GRSTCCRCSAAGFNGAAARTRRRARRPCHFRFVSVWLQWGRRTYAAESWDEVVEGVKLIWLQWGRRTYAAESPASGVTGSRSCRFNGAAARRRRRGWAAVAQVSWHGNGLQWGRRTYAAESCRVKRRYGAIFIASMGPPHVRGGEPPPLVL